MRVSLEIPEEQVERAKLTATSLGVGVEELMAAGVTDFLRTPDDDFRTLAVKILSKNQELYNRLA